MNLLTRSVPVAAALLITGVLLAQPASKKPRDQGEFDVYSAAVADAANPAKQLQDLDTWSQKYPESDFKDERQWFYVSAYNATGRPDKVLEAASTLLAKDLKTTFSDPKQVITVLYLAAVNLQKIAAPTPAQIATGKKAASMLLEATPQFFTAANKPPATSDGDWAKARADLDTAARATQVYAALSPGNALLAANPKDPTACAGAEVEYRSALSAIPESSAVAYALAGSMLCQQAVHPEKAPQAIYEFARAAGLEPDKGGFADAQTRKSVDAYLRRAYTQFHGSDEGLDEVRRLAVQSPLPPPDFTIKTSSQVAAEREAEFARSNPQLALWMGMRKQLAAPGGDQFFDTQLKSARIPKLKGTIVEAKPACRPRELMVAISDSRNAEVKLKLDTPLAGKLETGAEIQWEGVGAAFTNDPFLLTLDVEKSAIENLQVAPCAPVVKKRTEPRTD